jgi:hypothetical protein
VRGLFGLVLTDYHLLEAEHDECCVGFAIGVVHSDFDYGVHVWRGDVRRRKKGWEGGVDLQGQRSTR